MAEGNSPPTFVPSQAGEEEKARRIQIDFIQALLTDPDFDTTVKTKIRSKANEFNFTELSISPLVCTTNTTSIGTTDKSAASGPGRYEG